MCWADDVVLLAHSRGALCTMLRDIVVAGCAVGLTLQTRKSEYAVLETTSDAGDMPLSPFPLPARSDVSARGYMQLLGSKLAQNGDDEVDFQARLQAGWRQFWKHKSLWSIRGHVARRLQALSCCMAPAAKFGLPCGFSSWRARSSSWGDELPITGRVMGSMPRIFAHVVLRLCEATGKRCTFSLGRGRLRLPRGGGLDIWLGIRHRGLHTGAYSYSC